MQIIIFFQLDSVYFVNVEPETADSAVSKDNITYMGYLYVKSQVFFLPVQVFLCTQSQASLM